MFENSPANLPVEPGATPPPAAPPKPMAMSEAMAQSPKKEPEDIFSDIKMDGNGASPMREMTSLIEEAPPRSPVMIALIAVLGIAVLGGLGFAVWFFFFKPASPATESVTINNQQPTTPTTPTPPESSAPAPEPTPTPEPTPEPTPTPEPNIPPPTPVTQPIPTPASPDSDADGLTDLEETLLGTNPQVADSDGDTYTDGAEVKSSFDPAQAKLPLTASKNLQLTTWNGIQLYYPTAWTWNTDPLTVSQATLQTTSAARLQFELRENPSNQSLSDWIGPTASDFISSKTKAGYEMRQSRDGLQTYLSIGSRVLVIKYDPNGDTAPDAKTLVQALLSLIKAAS